MNNKIKKILSSWVGITILFIAGGGIVYGLNTVATGYNTTASNKVVNVHGVCRYVKDTGSSFFIPTKTAAEWTSVRNSAGGIATLQITTPPTTNWAKGTFYNCAENTTGNPSIDCASRCSTPEALNCWEIVSDYAVWGYDQCSGAYQACKCYRKCDVVETPACGTSVSSNCNNISSC